MEANGTAKVVTEVTVKDPDTGLSVEVTIFKHSNGGMFGIDSSYIDQILGDEQSLVQDPLNELGYVQIS